MGKGIIYLMLMCPFYTEALSICRFLQRKTVSSSGAAKHTNRPTAAVAAFPTKVKKGEKSRVDRGREREREREREERKVFPKASFVAFP